MNNMINLTRSLRPLKSDFCFSASRILCSLGPAYPFFFLNLRFIITHPLYQWVSHFELIALCFQERENETSVTPHPFLLHVTLASWRRYIFKYSLIYVVLVYIQLYKLSYNSIQLFINSKQLEIPTNPLVPKKTLHRIFELRNREQTGSVNTVTTLENPRIYMNLLAQIFPDNVDARHRS